MLLLQGSNAEVVRGLSVFNRVMHSKRSDKSKDAAFFGGNVIIEDLN